MSIRSKLQHVSESPTRPTPGQASRRFDVAELYQGLLAEPDARPNEGAPLHEKLQRAYWWIVNKGIISPFYDIEYNGTPPQRFSFGDAKVQLTLPTDQSYSSYVLLPLLSLATRRRCLLVGGPGRGKTAIAVLMGVLAGYNLNELKRAIQHGQPQMTIADLLGNPLPSTLVNAKSMDEVQIAWRRWLGMRVKIIDEYNRIPTRTQSALLTVMADNYAELYDQIFECPPGAWYLTANDDAGGGTYQVIEALRDRIDVVVKALHFNSRYLDELLLRVEEGFKPEEVVPSQIIFTAEELDQMEREIRQVKLPEPLRRRLEFFTSHFELWEGGARQLEYMTKDTVKLSGLELRSFATASAGKDAAVDLGAQTRNGVSVRALMTTLVFVKGMAYFRGEQEVSFEDIRQMLPFVLHDKLVQEPDAPFFELGDNPALRSDRVSWLRELWDLSCKQFESFNLDHHDPVRDLGDELERGLEGVKEEEVRRRLAAIETALRELAKGRKLYGHLYDDLLRLKAMHQHYTNYLRWLLQ